MWLCVVCDGGLSVCVCAFVKNTWNKRTMIGFICCAYLKWDLLDVV